MGIKEYNKSNRFIGAYIFALEKGYIYDKEMDKTRTR
jgi:hypothetical protein